MRACGTNLCVSVEDDKGDGADTFTKSDEFCPYTRM